jgi:hypothetical protein
LLERPLAASSIVARIERASRSAKGPCPNAEMWRYLLEEAQGVVAVVHWMD